mmetsp:Transcript_15280/g.23007  ORF Transcript_15280/g.23007 Transcript_15280/m.23007 type:complete len:862 (+) Transcript_15280:57-2642(+)
MRGQSAPSYTGRSRRGRSSINSVTILFTAMVIFAIYVCFFYAPAVEVGAEVGAEVSAEFMAKTSYVYNRLSSGPSLKEKIYGMIPKHPVELDASVWNNSKSMGNSGRESDRDLPDWSEEHLSPTSISISSDPLITLCPLNFKGYSQSPHLFPMFKDLVGSSRCSGGRTQHKRVSVIRKEIQEASGTPAGRVVYPTAFFFHESRVGSTLIANLLGSDPYNMVFSESAPPAEVLLRCEGCSHKRQLEVFRQALMVMGRSPVHERLFFKFQSITTTKIMIALEAFPDVPWAFVFRQPVQTMMSHMDPRKGGGRNAPCMRSRRRPPAKVKDALKRVGASASADKEAWCAAHLNMLCEHAVEAYEKYGVYDEASLRANSQAVQDGVIRAGRAQVEVGAQRGILIDYQSLPGIIPRVVLPLFGVEPSDQWVQNMITESQEYSKGRGKGPKSGTFKGDSADKEKHATDAIEQWAEKILAPTYNKMYATFRGVVEKELSEPIPRLENNDIDWNAVKIIPSRGSPKSVSTFGLRRETSAARLLYNPFESTYNSTPFEYTACPPTPAPSYPSSYPMKTILDHWNTDDTTIPPMHYSTLCRFDFQTEQEKALAYRNAEVPFITYNHPGVDEVRRKWADFDYLNSRVGPSTTYRSEVSKDNHFMYWRNVRGFTPKDGSIWKPPTGHESYTFENWLTQAVRDHNKTLDDRDHVYFRVSSSGRRHWLFDELPFFKPEKSLFIVEPSEQKGIHCRFGMRSVIAECHFDGSRNFVASFGGLRRWIIAHPNQCKNLALLPRKHPSGRHSEIDWSKPDYDKYPLFKDARASEIIIKPGEVLYVPTFWFHYIISLNINFQCNTRSGVSHENDKVIRKCGF